MVSFPKALCRSHIESVCSKLSLYEIYVSALRGNVREIGGDFFFFFLTSINRWRYIMVVPCIGGSYPYQLTLPVVPLKNIRVLLYLCFLYKK